jgi:hypothetical protein
LVISVFRTPPSLCCGRQASRKRASTTYKNIVGSRDVCEVHSHDLKKGGSEEDAKEKVGQQRPVPSRHIRRMRSATMDVCGSAGSSQRRSCSRDTLGRCGITRCGAPVPAAATRRFHDYRGPLSGHDPPGLRLTAGLMATRARGAEFTKPNAGDAKLSANCSPWSTNRSSVRIPFEEPNCLHTKDDYPLVDAIGLLLSLILRSGPLRYSDLAHP